MIKLMRSEYLPPAPNHSGTALIKCHLYKIIIQVYMFANNAKVIYNKLSKLYRQWPNLGGHTQMYRYLTRVQFT